MISEQIVQELAEQLFTCFESGSAIAPITEAYPTLTIEEAYAVIEEGFDAAAVFNSIKSMVAEVQRYVPGDTCRW